jgi:hypothetical protein
MKKGRSVSPAYRFASIYIGAAPTGFENRAAVAKIASFAALRYDVEDRVVHGYAPARGGVAVCLVVGADFATAGRETAFSANVAASAVWNCYPNANGAGVKKLFSPLRKSFSIRH